MKFELPELPYQVDALEPHISKNTLELHHERHHQAYLISLNNLIAGTKFENKDLETIIKITDGPVFNNASQAWNHTFYFEGLKPSNSNTLKSSFAGLIKENFGSAAFFKDSFLKAATSIFGSGWVWLVKNPNGSMEIVQEGNAGNPLRRGLVPLLTCDVWEHAYYLDYKNSRTDYIEAFWNLINWDMIEKRYFDSIQK